MPSEEGSVSKRREGPAVMNAALRWRKSWAEKGPRAVWVERWGRTPARSTPDANGRKGFPKSEDRRLLYEFADTEGRKGVAARGAEGPQAVPVSTVARLRVAGTIPRLRSQGAVRGAGIQGASGAFGPR